MLTLSTSCIHN